MQKRQSNVWMIVALTLATAVAAPSQAEAIESTDLLSRQAAMTERAAMSVQLALAVAGNRIVSAGERGIVLISDDNGESWQQRQTPVSVALTALSFPTSSVGWAVGHGGVVLKTVDAGNHWVKVFDGASAAQIELKAARELSGENADRALRDAERMVQEGSDKPLLAANFPSADLGIVVGAYGMAYRTNDGGKSWKTLRYQINDTRSRHLYGVEIIGEKIFLVGELGALFVSLDNAASFEDLPMPYEGTLFGLLMQSNGDLLTYGLRGNVYRRSHGEAAWQKVTMARDVTLAAGVVLRDGALVLADGAGRLLSSKDNGKSFKQLKSPPFTGLTDLVQAQDGALVLSGLRGVTRKSLISVGN